MIKIVLITFSATIAAVALAAFLFLNSILGAFGLVSTSLGTFSNLQQSKQTLDLVKKRHKTKKANISKKFVKRTSKKVAASAVSAATVGTAMVVITVAGLEVIDYCNDKEELLNDGNILFRTGDSFDYYECMSEAKNDSSEIIASTREVAPQFVSMAWEDTKKISLDTWESTKVISKNTWAATVNSGLETWASTKDSSAKAWATTSSESEKLWGSLIEWAEEQSN